VTLGFVLEFGGEGKKGHWEGGKYRGKLKNIN